MIVRMSVAFPPECSVLESLDRTQASNLLTMAAPMIKPMLARQGRPGHLDATGFGRILAEQNQTIQKTAPQLGGFARVIGADGDGGMADDIVKGVGKLFRH
jgi:hypothetical protein